MTRSSEPLTVADLEYAPSFPGARVELYDGSMVVSPPGEGLYTSRHRDQLTRDGRRHELLGGVLVVTPAPTPRHQFVADAVFRLLADACPAGLRAVTAPLDVALHNTLIQPDVVVARSADFGEHRLEAPPVLAVEVLSPSTRTIDLTLKKAILEEAGVPSYWVVDPVGPSLIAFELVSRRYLQVADVSGGEAWTATTPFPVTIVPEELG